MRPDRLAELTTLTSHILSKNVVTIRELRSYVGKCQSMASLLFTWRPFLSMLWAALYCEDTGGAPSNCIWTKQILEPLTWISEFLTQEHGCVYRIFECDTFFNRGDKVILYFDASTTGFGSVMECNGVCIKHMSGRFNDLDCRVLNVTNEGSKAQQSFEALALLITFREWLPFLRDHRCCLSVRGDNMAALSLLCRMQPKSPSLNLVARELALAISLGSYLPDIVQHIPGVSNTIADALSRRFEVANFVLPSQLEYSYEHVPEVRDEAWWLTRRV